MKLNYLLTIAFLFTFLNLLPAKNIEVYFNYCRFKSPDRENYIETHLSIIGKSLIYNLNSDGKFQAELEVILLLKDGEKIIDFKKVNLKSPEYNDTVTGYNNFIDLQRLSAPSGKYELEVSIMDLNVVDAKPSVYNESIDLSFSALKVEMSDVVMVETYTKTDQKNILSKAGYDLVPYVSNFYPKTLKKLAFYSEIYNTNTLGLDEKYLLSYYLESFETGHKMNEYNSFARKELSPISVVLNEFNIEKLPTGNYNLVIEARDKNNKLLVQKKQLIQRSNLGAAINISDLASLDIGNSFVSKINDHEVINEYIYSLSPLASHLEQVFIENQLLKTELTIKKQFLYSFWLNRDQLYPEKAWNKYKLEVEKVNSNYATKVKKGYMTDRGRVYLKYGVPNSISTNYNEPDAYPYEIWHYFKIGNFSNKRFVFYNADLVTNDFSLLHSDMFGETNNPRWKIVLHQRNTMVTDFDQENVPNKSYGSDVDNLYKNPR